MPMEELLAMYGVGATSSVPPPSHSSLAGGGDAPLHPSRSSPTGGMPSTGAGLNGAGDGVTAGGGGEEGGGKRPFRDVKL